MPARPDCTMSTNLLQTSSQRRLYMMRTAPLPKFIETSIKEHGPVTTRQPTGIMTTLSRTVCRTFGPIIDRLTLVVVSVRTLRLRIHYDSFWLTSSIRRLRRNVRHGSRLSSRLIWVTRARTIRGGVTVGDMMVRRLRPGIRGTGQFICLCSGGRVMMSRRLSGVAALAGGSLRVKSC